MAETTTKDLDVTEIDEISAPPVEPEAVAQQPDAPAHLMKHECGLWMIFVVDMSLENEDGKGTTHYNPKKELVQYLMDHSIGQPNRSSMQVTPTERKLYDIYAAAQRKNRVTKDHFIAALRLCYHGFELWPQKSKNLNEMKVI